MRYSRDELSIDGLSLAKGLIGARLYTKIGGITTGGIIVETEAYLGKEDRAAHSCHGDPKGRTRVLYGPGGYAYIYLIYGMYHCLNLAAGRAGDPQCVLIRSIYPTIGLDAMEERRDRRGISGLCDGPGKLCKALGIDASFYGADLLGDRIWLEKGTELPYFATPRIGVDYAGEDATLLYRFVAADLTSLGYPEYRNEYRKILRSKKNVEE